jgi:hypothetical protein
MKKGVITPVLTAMLFAAACGGGGESTAPEPVDPRPSVRFFNAMRAMAGPGGFTTNGQFVSGSAVGANQSACVKLDAGSRSFGFGTANTGGTGLSGGAIATLNNQTIAASGNYTVAAVGSGMHALLFLIDDSFSGSLGGNQAAVRFVNFAPAVGSHTVMSGSGSGSMTTVASNLGLGASSPFTTVASGSNAYTVVNGGNTVVSGSAGTLNLQAGTVNTIAIVPGAAAGTFQLMTIPRCP